MVTVSGFVMGVVDAAIGMGYGTILVPALLVAGCMHAFSKGLSGGGYGPIVTAGQIMSGVAEKSAVSITSLSEALVSLIAVLTFILARGSVNWVLAYCLVLSFAFSPRSSLYCKKN